MTICVITGAGSGLGRAMALELAGRGLQVAALGRRADALNTTASLSQSDRIIAFPVDVADASSVATVFNRIEDRLGPVDILINNAAVYPRQDFLETSAADFMATVGINLGGIVACSSATLRGMVARGHGRILNVSSFADVAPLSGSSAYSVSKGAARLFTRALVADIADRFPQIVINDWIPGALATEMGLASGLDPALAARWGAELALMRDPSLSGTIWSMDQELPPPRSLKQRMADRLLRRTPHARRLSANDNPATR